MTITICPNEYSKTVKKAVLSRLEDMKIDNSCYEDIVYLMYKFKKKTLREYSLVYLNNKILFELIVVYSSFSGINNCYTREFKFKTVKKAGKYFHIKKPVVNSPVVDKVESKTSENRGKSEHMKDAFRYNGGRAHSSNWFEKTYGGFDSFTNKH